MAIQDNSAAEELIIHLKNKESGFGTRKSGEKIRNEIINLYKQTSPLP